MFPLSSGGRNIPQFPEVGYVSGGGVPAGQPGAVQGAVVLPGAGFAGEAQGRRHRLRQDLPLVGLAGARRGIGAPGERVLTPAGGPGGRNPRHQIRAKDPLQFVAGKAFQFARLLQFP